MGAARPGAAVAFPNPSCRAAEPGSRRSRRRRPPQAGADDPARSGVSSHRFAPEGTWTAVCMGPPLNVSVSANAWVMSTAMPAASA
jgi:hypothetical protein